MSNTVAEENRGGDSPNGVLGYATPNRPTRHPPANRVVWWVLFCAVVMIYATFLGGLVLFVVGPFWKA
jgi:hypothetical protein